MNRPGATDPVLKRPGRFKWENEIGSFFLSSNRAVLTLTLVQVSLMQMPRYATLRGLLSRTRHHRRASAYGPGMGISIRSSVFNRFMLICRCITIADPYCRTYRMSATFQKGARVRST